MKLSLHFLTIVVCLAFREGEYGVGPGHVPSVAQLKPGVLQIIHDEASVNEPEKYFVAGGYAMTHADSTTVR